MKRKPSLSKMKERSSLWFDGRGLRIVLSWRENGCDHRECECCNSWWYDMEHDEWMTSFFTPRSVRELYEFIGWI